MKKIIFCLGLFSSFSYAAELMPPPIVDVDPVFMKKLKTAANTTSEQQADAIKNVPEVVSSVLPATPEEIKLVKEKARLAEKLTNEREVPKNTITRDVYWSVGDPAPVINMVRGFTTTLVFFGSKGEPMILNNQGMQWGDQEALNPSVYLNMVSLSVAKPWRATNGTIVFNGFYAPLNVTLLSSSDGDVDSVDYQVRIHVLAKVEATERALNRPDAQNMSLLLRLIAGIKNDSDNLTALSISSVEKADIAAGMQWVPIRADLAQVFIGADNRTYVTLRPGLKLRGVDVLAFQKGPDGSMGYILAGNQPRVFTALDEMGGAYRIIVQR